MRYYIIKYTRRPLGESGELCNSVYDLSDACVICGTGAKLIGHLIVKGFSTIKKDFFETNDGDFIISGKLYKQLRENFDGIVLNHVRDIKDHDLNYYHFTSNIILPKFKIGSTGFVIEDQCQTCKRNGYFTDAEIGNGKDIPTIIHPYIFKYDKEDVEKYKNELILNIWECFGLSNRVETDKHRIRYARPLTIVNEKIHEYFEKNKFKDITYEEIIIE